MSLAPLFWIALGGALGTLGRYGLSNLVQRLLGGDFPWGTAAVNLVGSFLFGLVWALTEDQHFIQPELRGVLLTGFMGAFTTFSTFMFDSHLLLRNDMLLSTLLNLGGQIVLGLLAMAGGIALARIL